MKRLKKILKWFSVIILLPFGYILISLILTYIPVNNDKIKAPIKNKSIYLSSNGIHLDIIIAKENVSPYLLRDLKYLERDKYFAFGWGDKKFYLETATWSDLTFKNAFQAIFLKSSTLIHSSVYSNQQKYWVEVSLNQKQLDRLNQYIYESFYLDSAGQKKILKNKGYSYNDYFYEAKGSYSALNTCNSWANSALKQSGIKSCLWTPFDFGLLELHKNNVTN